MFKLALYVLSFLEPKSLLKAAQTCRYWRVLAEDNLLWREKCREESIDDNLVYGINRLRRRHTSRCPWKSLYMRQHQIELNWRTGEIPGPKVCMTHTFIFHCMCKQLFCLIEILIIVEIALHLLSSQNFAKIYKRF